MMAADDREPGEAYCKACPDHEACFTGMPCGRVKAAAKLRADFKEAEQVAKNLYTEQRGRVNGNTVAWDDLTPAQRSNIIIRLDWALDIMKEAWQWPAASSSS
jgi:hypothetical protein